MSRALKTPYDTFGRLIQDELSPCVGDVIVWLSIDGEDVVTLYRFDSEECQWYWESDWWEGEGFIILRSFCLLEYVTPVIHAHWIETEDLAGNHYIECSHCNWDFWLEGENAKQAELFHCPRCGAKMDEVN